MTAVDQLRELFHFVAGLLVWPVLLGLLGLIAAMLVALGAFAREAWQRRRGCRPLLDRAREGLDRIAAAGSGDGLDIQLEEHLQTTEREGWRKLGRLRLAVRVGPSLGLMGTLIPMADALQGLADGNLPALASNMVTAFAATVIGLTVSVIAYLIAAARESWVRADSQALAFHAERLLRQTSSVPSADKASDKVGARR
ncbi:MAG: MotA/TolQ/ExbB proton channel family protein [Verrucomicrobiales bacterium]|nr:MotA/TolQ/ExbB proton channel family protein [Verrucomicrobiales bacterium]